MAFTVLTPARSSALILLSQVKSLLKITDSSEDAALAFWIAVATSKIGEYCGFVWGRQRVKEKLIGSGRTRLFLSQLPVEPESLTIEIDGEAVTDWTLENAELGILYRKGGWEVGTRGAVGEDSEANISATYRGGYLLPGDIGDWTASTPYTAGQFVRLSSPSTLRLECTTPGTSHATTAPTMPAAAGGTVTDAGVTWTARTAWELLPVVSEYCYVETVKRWKTSSMPAGLASIEADSFSASFFATQTETALSKNVMDGLDILRGGRGGMA